MKRLCITFNSGGESTRKDCASLLTVAGRLTRFANRFTRQRDAKSTVPPRSSHYGGVWASRQDPYSNMNLPSVKQRPHVHQRLNPKQSGARQTDDKTLFPAVHACTRALDDKRSVGKSRLLNKNPVNFDARRIVYGVSRYVAATELTALYCPDPKRGWL